MDRGGVEKAVWNNRSQLLSFCLLLYGWDWGEPLDPFETKRKAPQYPLTTHLVWRHQLHSLQVETLGLWGSVDCSVSDTQAYFSGSPTPCTLSSVTRGNTGMSSPLPEVRLG